MEIKKEMKIWRGLVLFVMALFASMVLQMGQAFAAEPIEEDYKSIPEGSYTPKGSSLTYTFTGGTDGLGVGYYANVESYSAGAFEQDGTLDIPETIIYKKNPENDEEEGKKVEVKGVLRRAFSGCTSLTHLILPNTVSYIGQEAFSNCSNLTSIQTGPDSAGNAATGNLAAEEIEYRAFYGCTSLTGISLGEKGQGNRGVQTVQSEVFMNCSNLNSIEIGRTISWIEGGAFANCQSLDGLTGGVKVRDNPIYFVQNGILYYRESNSGNVLLCCPAGTQVGILTEFPDNVTQIRNEAFYGCRGLSSITIPNTVRTIGDRAFYDCIGLGNVTIPSSVTTIGAEVFRNCSSGLCIICAAGSAAERYAITNNITRSVECTVTFYNTETRQTVEKKVMSGETVDPPVGWERAGYVLRWTDDFNSGTVITSNRTINTVWKKLYTVTFRDPSDNKESVVTGVEEGTEAAAPNWTKKGYRLTWSTENYKRVNSDLTVDAVWLVSLTDDNTQQTQTTHKNGYQISIGNIIYEISSAANRRVRVKGLVNKNVTTVSVPNTVSFDGTVYTVTCISANAFRGNKYIKKATLGTNIRSIEHYAFYNCSKLTRVVIKSRVLVNISNYAFKKTIKSLKVYVPTRGLISNYRSLLLDGGMSTKAKVAKIPT